MTVPSGSAVTADLRCSAFVTGTATTSTPNGCEMSVQLRDALGVRAAADADPDRAAVLQHVAAVERAGRLDSRDAIPLSAHGVLGRGDLGPAAHRLQDG